MKKIFSILMTCSLLLAAFVTNAQFSFDVSIKADIAPPPLPFYVQPPCPEDGLLWIPGYWAYDEDEEDYYWVPGVWVSPPEPGYLWTPCYWGYDRGIYGWHPGYWGTHVGFYGGVNYGYGYCGTGFVGGRWEGEEFSYNTAVMNVNTTIVHNTYINRTVINNTTITNSRTCFNGGPGGIAARPSRQEQMTMREYHQQPTNEQINHQQLMSRDRNQFVSFNHGRPATAAMNAVKGNRYNVQGHPTGLNNYRSNGYFGSTNQSQHLNPSGNSRMQSNRQTMLYPQQRQNEARQQQFNQQRAAQQQQIARQQQFDQQRAVQRQNEARQQQFNQQRAAQQQITRQQQWERQPALRSQQSMPQHNNNQKEFMRHG